MKTAAPTLLLSAFVMVSGCQGDVCKDEPPSFQLDIRTEDAATVSQTRSLFVQMSIDGQQYEQTYAIEDELADGQTALAVEVDDRALTANFSVELTLTAYSQPDSAGQTVAESAGRFSATPDGCNRFALTLAPDPNPCVPTPNIIGDGQDQDCDGFDECYQDADDDGLGSMVVMADNDLDCTNDSARTSSVSTDCNDNDNTIPGVEVVGDNVDQDCDGRELCYRDADEDGFGTPEIVEDNDLDCLNDSAIVNTAALATDCDDNDPTNFPGEACDDNDPCTIDDICDAGQCRGTPEPGCTTECDTSCPPTNGSTCCIQPCMGGNCPACPANTSCDLVCRTRECTAACRANSSCRVEHTRANRATTTVVCESGAMCELECATTNDNSRVDCTLECQQGAACLLRRCQALGEDSSEDCTLNCPDDDQLVDCGDGALACGTPCP